jgi:isopropylmalate/homocitrate/citramalate synthase
MWCMTLADLLALLAVVEAVVGGNSLQVECLGRADTVGMTQPSPHDAMWVRRTVLIRNALA